MTNISGVNKNLVDRRSKDTHGPQCPSCNTAIKTCHHVLHHKKERRVQALGATITLSDQWTKTVGIHPALRYCLRDYVRQKGGVTMSGKI